MDYVDYREKLGVGFNDAEKIDLFYIKIENYFQTRMDFQINAELEITFCNNIGIRYKLEEVGVLAAIASVMEKKLVGLQRIWRYLSELKSNFNEFIAALIVFCNTYVEEINEQKQLIKYIKKALTESHILFDVIEDEDGCFIFPKGAKELDDKTVSQPLEWLNSYPNAHKSFVKAIKGYSSISNENASDVADLFRKSLETFFQEFFGGEKNLENYKNSYGEYLKMHNIPNEIINNFQKLLEQYTLYMNKYAKHHDKSSKNVLEYIMYQTGNIIRLLITLKQEDNETQSDYKVVKIDS